MCADGFQNLYTVNVYVVSKKNILIKLLKFLFLKNSFLILGRWAAKLGDQWLRREMDGFAKLVARLFAIAALLVRKQSSLKNTKWAT